MARVLIEEKAAFIFSPNDFVKFRLTQWGKFPGWDDLIHFVVDVEPNALESSFVSHSQILLLEDGRRVSGDKLELIDEVLVEVVGLNCT